MNIKLVAFNLLVGAGLASIVAAPVMAQSANSADALKDFKTESSDPFSNRGGDSYNGIFDLIHRVMQGSPDSATFQAQQQQNLDDAAAAFKQMQKQRLEAQQPQATSPAPVVTPATP
jgi:hypothetical protein